MQLLAFLASVIIVTCVLAVARRRNPARFYRQLGFRHVDGLQQHPWKPAVVYRPADGQWAVTYVEHGRSNTPRISYVASKAAALEELESMAGRH